MFTTRQLKDQVSDFWIDAPVILVNSKGQFDFVREVRLVKLEGGERVVVLGSDIPERLLELLGNSDETP